MADLEKFRAETRAWLAANCPPEMRKPITQESDVFWGGRNTTFASEPQRLWFERMRDKVAAGKSGKGDGKSMFAGLFKKKT